MTNPSTPPPSPISASRKRSPVSPAKSPPKKHPRRPRLSITIQPPESIFLKESVISDDDAKQNIAKICSEEGFMDEIKVLFKKKFKTENEVSITKTNDIRGVNSNCHFIINHNDKEYHIKPALHGIGTSVGSKFNEIFFYKINEELKIGPQCEGILTKDGILMIVTEDLKHRKTNHAKETSYKDSDEESRLSIPRRNRDSVHRCALEFCVKLFNFFDIKKNYPNTGIKTSIFNFTRKEKAMIVDFRIANNDDHLDHHFTMETLENINIKEVDKYFSELDSFLTSNENPPAQEIFSFKKDPQIYLDALSKLFISDDGEINRINVAIEKSKNYTLELIKSDEHHKEELKEYHKKIVENMCDQKMAAVKLVSKKEHIKNTLDIKSAEIKMHLPQNNIGQPQSSQVGPSGGKSL
ncbi:MAG: hypothetical protein FJX30_02525 [Alphaproteobacteria bacterium]|nr:hypothetical protein [Alphaproteobacteria bacterium]